MSDKKIYTQADMDRVKAACRTRLYICPIYKKSSPDIDDLYDYGAVMYVPDRVVGARFYIEQDGKKSIYVTQEMPSGNTIFTVYIRDWDEADPHREHLSTDDDL